MIGDKSRWTIRFFNGGSGHAIVSKVRYSVGWRRTSDDHTTVSWLDFRSTLNRLRAARLIEGDDFALFHFGEGAALPAVKSSSDGIELAAFGERCLSALRAFDIWIQVTDTVGDTHERILRCLEPLAKAEEDE
jgi:hypothetical protein